MHLLFEKSGLAAVGLGDPLGNNSLWGGEPAALRRFCIALVEIEAACKNLKDDPQLRPIYHQLEERIEAHTASIT